jgi:hypothetical protein
MAAATDHAAVYAWLAAAERGALADAELKRGPAYWQGATYSGGPAFQDFNRTRRAPGPPELVESFKQVVFACATLNANAVARTPLRLYVKTGRSQGRPKALTAPATARLLSRVEGPRPSHTAAWVAKQAQGSDALDEVLEHPLLDALDAVNEDWDHNLLIQYSVLCLDVIGRAYWWMEQAKGAWKVWPLLAQYVLPVRDPDTSLIREYHYGDETYEPGQLVRMRRVSMRDPYGAGFGPHEASFPHSALSDQFVGVQENLLNQGARPSLLVTPKDPDAPMGPAERSRLQHEINATLSRGGIGLAWVVDSALDAKTLTFPPSDLAALQISENAVQRVANCFGVPLSLLKTEDVNLANAEAGHRQHAELAVDPRCVLIASALTRWTRQEGRRIERGLKARGQSVSLGWDRLFWAFDNPVKEDEERQSKIFTGYLAAGVLTPNEVRTHLGYPPREGGDEPATAAAAPGGKPGDDGEAEAESGPKPGPKAPKAKALEAPRRRAKADAGEEVRPGGYTDKDDRHRKFKVRVEPRITTRRRADGGVEYRHGDYPAGQAVVTVERDGARWKVTDHTTARPGDWVRHTPDAARARAAARARVADYVKEGAVRRVVRVPRGESLRYAAFGGWEAAEQFPGGYPRARREDHIRIRAPPPDPKDQKFFAAHDRDEFTRGAVKVPGGYTVPHVDGDHVFDGNFREARDAFVAAHAPDYWVGADGKVRGAPERRRGGDHAERLAREAAKPGRSAAGGGNCGTGAGGFQPGNSCGARKPEGHGHGPGAGKPRGPKPRRRAKALLCTGHAKCARGTPCPGCLLKDALGTLGLADAYDAGGLDGPGRLAVLRALRDRGRADLRALAESAGGETKALGSGFFAAAAAYLKSLFTAGALALLGPGELSDAEARALDAALAGQVKYLGRWRRDVLAGEAGLDPGRAEGYGAAVWPTAQNLVLVRAKAAGHRYGRRVHHGPDDPCDNCHAAVSLGWVPIAGLPPLGDCRGMNNCHCEIETAAHVPAEKAARVAPRAPKGRPKPARGGNRPAAPGRRGAGNPNHDEHGRFSSGPGGAGAHEPGGGWPPGDEALRRAVKDYAAGDHGQVNRELRQGRPPGPKALALDAALAGARLPEAVTVYRGVSDHEALKLAKGAVLRDRGFLSTSLEPRVAREFAGAGPRAAVVEIRAPAGARGAAVGALTSFPGEREVLFARDARIRVTGKRVDRKHGLTVFTAELSHD